MATEKRLIDANDALERLQKAEKEMMVVTIVGCKAVPMDGVIEFIQTRPTVDAVEVVRCKDCKHWIRQADFCPFECQIFNSAYETTGYHTNADDFCSYGERKDNGK